MHKFRSTVSLKNGRITLKKKKKKSDNTLDATFLSESVAGDPASPSPSASSSFIVSPERSVLRTPPGSPGLARTPEKTIRPPRNDGGSAKKKRRVDDDIVEEAKEDEEEKVNEDDQTLSAGFGRHEVVEVTQRLSEITLTLEKTSSGTRTTCALRGSWATTAVAAGDVVHVLQAEEADESGALRVDDRAGLVVVNPDGLVSGTSIVSTLFCMRKAVLNEKFKGMEGES